MASAKRHQSARGRFIQLCEGNDEIIIMGNADTGKMRLIAEIDKKGRIAQGEVATKVS
jgi:predicted ATP-dependent Lon-type protease